MVRSVRRRPLIARDDLPSLSLLRERSGGGKGSHPVGRETGTII